MANSRSESPSGCLVLYSGSYPVSKPYTKRGVAGVTKGIHGSAKGKNTMPGPGERTIVFRHCEERKIL